MIARFQKFWYLVFVVPLFILLPFLGQFIYSKGADFNDLVISHYPNAVWIQQSIQKWGEIPLWSSTILSGYPFAADPLSGLHYPPGWLAILFPQPFGLNLVMALHLILGGVGMYLFLRAEGLDHPVSIFGALAFELMPKLFAHLGAGHVTLIYAVSWTPLLLLAQKRAGKAWWRPAAILGLIFLADPRWAALSGLFWLAYGLRTAYSEKIGRWRVLSWFEYSLVCALFAALLGAVLLFPLAEYASLSTRRSMVAADNLTLSLPPVQLLGFVTPSLGGTAEWATYPGGLILLLALLGLGIPEARKSTRFWLVAALAGTVFAMGSAIPGFSLLMRIPGFNLLRVPPRALFVSGFSLIIAAAGTLQSILKTPELLRKMPRFNPLLMEVAVAFFLLLIAGAGWAVTKEFPLRFAWGALALTGGLVLIFWFRAEKIRAPVFGLLCMAWLFLDLVGSNLAGLEFHAKDEILALHGQAAEYLSQNANGQRIYSPSYSLPQQTAVKWGLELADGVDPLQLDNYASFMRKGMGIQNSDYSVTLPPFASGDTSVDNRDAKPDPPTLGIFHIGFVASEFDLAVEGLKEVARFSTTRIYQNLRVLPAAWVQSPAVFIGQGIISEAVVSKTANQVTVEATGPGLLVVSEIYYPGWTAVMDGKKIVVKPLFGLLRGFDLPAGKHTVEMVFRPVSLWWGLGISLLAWLVIGWLELRFMRNQS